MHKTFLMSFSDKRDDRWTSVQIDIHLPPLDKSYSPIISSICGPKNHLPALAGCGSACTTTSPRLPPSLWIDTGTTSSESRPQQSRESREPPLEEQPGVGYSDWVEEGGISNIRSKEQSGVRYRDWIEKARHFKLQKHRN